MWTLLLLVCASSASLVLCNDPDGITSHLYPWDTVTPVFSEKQGARNGACFRMLCGAPSDGSVAVLPVTSHFCQCNITWGNNFMSSQPNSTRPVDKVCRQVL